MIPQSLSKIRRLSSTGASSGIGKACAIALAEAGAAVGINYAANSEEANQVVELILGKGGEAIAVKADVSREEEVRAMSPRSFGRLARSIS